MQIPDAWKRFSLFVALFLLLLGAACEDDRPDSSTRGTPEPRPTVGIQPLIEEDRNELPEDGASSSTLGAIDEPLGEEDLERLLAGLSNEERAIAQLITQAELNCFLTRLGDSDFIEANEESNQEALASLIEVWIEFWEPCITPERDAEILLGTLEEYYGSLSPETAACVREKVRQNQDSHPGYRYRALVASSTTAFTCLNESEDLEGEISLFELSFGGPITTDERACLRHVGRDPQISIFGAVNRIDLGRPEHPAFDCFTRERLIEFRIQRFSARFDFEELPEAQLNCVHQVYSDAEDIRENLNSEEERSDAHSMFEFAATFGCLSAEQLHATWILSALSASEADEVTQCLSPLLREDFPWLYREEVGPRMFASRETWTPQQQTAMASFEARLGECLPADG